MGRKPYCRRRQVGALIVKDKMIISDGYNGTPSGFERTSAGTRTASPSPMCCTPRPTRSPRSRSPATASEGATLYVTAAPCIECSKLIIQAGIKRVVYKDEYRLTDGVDLLRKAGITVEKVD